MNSVFEIDLATAVDPLVLAVDVGSTATRGALYDAHGRPVGRRAKTPHAFTTAADGTSTIDPDQVVDEVAGVIAELADRVEPGRVAAVALDTFASSMVLADEQSEPLTPCFSYADGRCGAEVRTLRAEVDETALQQRTGTRVHGSYWPARLRWLRRTSPDLLDRAAYVLSLGDHVLGRLTGVLATGMSTAAWTGMLDRRTGDWDPETVTLAGIRTEQLVPVHPLDTPLALDEQQRTEVAERWPSLAGARWYAAVADGLAANVGLGALDGTAVGASAATSGALRVLVDAVPERLPAGLWCYQVSSARWLVGGALNDVGRVLDWAERALVPDDDREPGDPDEPDDDVPLVVPFLTGERSTGWAADARAVVAGIGLSSGPAALRRGTVEGLALAYARIAAQLREVAPDARRVLAGGSVAGARPELLAALSDASGLPVTPVTIKRSTLHGTALLALQTLTDAAPAAPDQGVTHWPRPAWQRHYAERRDRFERLHAAALPEPDLP